MAYPFKDLEQKWRKRWAETNIYKFDPNSPKPKYFNLFMFPYPSGDKLHIGHWWNYGPLDTHARYKRMKGFNVFQPLGYDSFGLPAENYALKTGIHPAKFTKENILKFTDQFKSIGAMYDYDYMITTSEPEYYRWSQWLFLKLYEKGLVYQKEAQANFCPECSTVVANSEVDSEGRHERCNSIVEKKSMKSWFFKITAYAQQLLDDLEKVDFPEKTKAMQKNWIGRSEGAKINFKIDKSQLSFEVFTTRPDTLYGVTYCTIAPELALVDQITTPENRQAVEDYRNAVKTMTEIERQSVTKEKSGVFTGSYAINPINNEKVPIWISDYVLASYGTGCVMAVPAHDERDFAFAKKFNLPIKVVINPLEMELDSNTMTDAYGDIGVMIHSAEFTGLKSDEALTKIITKLEKDGHGEGCINFRIRDWNFSRQRYWGTPIPVIYCEKCGTVPVPEDQLPVLLPLDENVDIRPKGKAPLETINSFMDTTCPCCQGPAKRDGETMDTFVCSSWYYLRYLSPRDDKQPFDQELVNSWLPIDCYVGGPEHACGHLIYSRFITRALHDMGYLNFNEPYKKLVHQGLITRAGAKMSKSKGNAVSPDQFIEEFGTDVFRMYIMFMGNFREGGDWSDEGITGIDRFTNRIWRLVKDYKFEPSNETKVDEKLNFMLNNAMKEIAVNLEDLNFNTPIARLMELVNELYVYLSDKERFNSSFFQSTVRSFLVLLSPFAPHLAEELWETIGEKDSVFNEKWPEFDPKALVKSKQVITLQVNGKVRSNIDAPVDLTDDQIKALAYQDENVKRNTEGKEIVKVIVINGKAGKMLNIVVK